MINICTTVWNRPKATSNFLESIEQSSMKDYRVIILDQASNEPTQEVIKRFTDRLDHFIHIRLAKNIGACAGRIMLYKMFTDEYIVLTDNDILIPQNYDLNRQIEILDKYKNVQCVVPRPTTAGPESLVGMCMQFSPFENNLCEIKVAGTLMQMHRRENLLSAKAYDIPMQGKWSTCEQIVSGNFIEQGWKYVCIMDEWVDVMDHGDNWAGYEKEDIKDRYDKNNRIWDARPVISNKYTLEPLWSVEKASKWDFNERYIRNMV